MENINEANIESSERNKVIERASSFIGHNKDIRQMCQDREVSVNWLAEQFADFALAETSRLAERVKFEIADQWLFELSEMRDFSRDSADLVERFEPWLNGKLKEFDAREALRAAGGK